MNGYSEVLQIMLAMILISYLVMNANQTIVTNNVVMVEGELEEQVIAIAQNFVDESRATTYDENTVNGNVPVYIPEGFSTTMGPKTGENSRDNFNDFDDYNGWTETVIAANGIEYNVSISVSYYNGSSTVNSPQTMKLMTISIRSDYLTYADGSVKIYNFKSLRSFYAD